MSSIFPLLTVVIMCSMMVCTPAEKLKEDRSKWVNPDDMLNFDHSTNTMIKKNTAEAPDSVPPECPECLCPQTQGEATPCPVCNTEESKQEPVCDQATLPLLRQYIKTLLQHLDGQMPSGKSEDYLMHLTMSEDQASILQGFVNTANKQHVHDVHDILTAMIDRVATSGMGRVEKAVLWVEDKIGLSLHRVTQMFMLAFFASIVLYIEVKLQIAWRRRVSQLIVLMFVVSVPWTWYELYKQAEIRQQSVASKTIPTECKSGDLGTWSSLKSYFTLQEDKCHDYYENLMIDPIVKVPPTKAIAVTFVRFFVAPLKDVGGAFSEFIRALLIDLPVTLYPVALGMVVIFLFLFLFMWFGYSIRLPFFLTIERNPQIAVADNQLHQSIADANQQTLAQLEKIQAKLDSSENEMTDKLTHLENVQQAAIEYTLSSAPASPAESPSISKTEFSSTDASALIEKLQYMIENRCFDSPLKSTKTIKTPDLFTSACNDKGEPDQNTTDGKTELPVYETKVPSVDQATSLLSTSESVVEDSDKCAPIQRMVDTLLPDGVIESRDTS